MNFSNTINSISRSIGWGIDLGLRFTLEVLGAAGAVWGSSEVFGLRNAKDETNNNCWRIAAIVTGAMAFLRFVLLNANTQKCQRKTEDKTNESTNVPNLHEIVAEQR